MKSAAVLVACCLVLSCESPFAFTARIALITISPDTVNLQAGDSLQLSAQALDSSGSPVPNVQFLWSSSTDSIATVSSHGMVRSRVPGTVSISASAQSVNGRAGLVVVDRIVAIGIDQGPITTVPGASLTFTAFARDPSGYTFATPLITFHGTDTAVFTVSEDGLFQARAPGIASLVASADSVRGLVTIRVITATFTSVSAGEADHTCGITADSVAFCWGANDIGQLAVPSLIRSTAPVARPSALAFTAVHAGATFTCGEVVNDAPYCWGSNFRARLGVGANPPSSVVPLPVYQGLGMHGLSTGWNDACALDGGAAFCWGENPGAGGTAPVTYVPTPLTLDSTLVTLDVSVGFGCGLTASGAPYCWGLNQYGQLGDSSSADRNGPSPVSGNLTFVALGGGSSHACGLTAVGAAYCWGLNANGQLGTGDTTSHTFPVPVSTALSFRTLDAGGTRTCATAADSTAYCWGAGVTTPTAVSGGLRFRSLSVGDRHTCGLATDGRLYCWGANEVGQLGDGTLVDRPAPTLVLGQP